MTVKETLQKILADLPDSATWDEVQYRIYLQQVVQESDQQIDSGHGVTQAQAEERLAKWLVLCQVLIWGCLVVERSEPPVCNRGHMRSLTHLNVPKVLRLTEH